LAVLGKRQETRQVRDVLGPLFNPKCANFPDIYHSYLGLAALATMKDKSLKLLDPALCISISQKEKIEKLRMEALIPMTTYSKHGYSFSIRADDFQLEKSLV